jgi:hypothetical protein
VNIAFPIVVAATVAASVAAMSGTVACRRQPPNSSPTAAAAREAAPAYTAFGSGHLLRAVTEQGRFLTLEDGSRWEVKPSDQFQSADWQPEASMTVRVARGENGFTYELLNTTDDEGVMVKFIPRY